MNTRCRIDALADRMSAGYSLEAAKTGRALPDDEDDGPSFDEIVTGFEALETIDELKDANARLSSACRYLYMKCNHPAQADEATRILRPGG